MNSFLLPPFALGPFYLEEDLSSLAVKFPIKVVFIEVVNYNITNRQS